MKYIDEHSYTEPEHVNEFFFSKTGEKLNPKDTNQKTYAKIVAKNGVEAYYISTYQGVLFDPLGPYSRRENNVETAMKKVSKNTFDFYMIYLKTRNSIYMTKAQRGYLND